MRSKRLKPFLPTMIEALEGGDEPAAEAHFKSLLLARSAAIIERKLHHARRLKRRGLTPTEAGTLLNGQIPLLGPSPIGRIPVRLHGSRSGGSLRRWRPRRVSQHRSYGLTPAWLEAWPPSSPRLSPGCLGTCSGTSWCQRCCRRALHRPSNALIEADSEAGRHERSRPPAQPSDCCRPALRADCRGLARAHRVGRAGARRPTAH